MNDCIFCKIIQGKISADVVFEDEQLMVFHDINPKTKVHLLVIPKIHCTSLADMNESHQNLLGHMMLLLPKIAKQFNLNSGFRTIINTGKDGGQVVFHLHFHLLGGDNLPSFA